MTDTTGGIETVLAEHGEVWDDVALHGWSCHCGWGEFDVRHSEDEYRAHVAAAVRAHLLSDAVELRAARAVLDARRHRWDTEPHQGECITDARAALAAAVGGDTE